RHAGYEVAAVQIVAFMRDWRKNEARRYEKDGYPPHQVAVLPLRLWTPEECNGYLLDRVVAHQQARRILPRCTDEDRWKKPTTWAVMREGRKSAIRVYPTELEANTAAIGAQGAGIYVEKRPGLAVRCAQYCAVKDICISLGDNQFQQGDLGDDPVEGFPDQPESGF